MDKILVIDDSKFSQQMLSMFLGKDYELFSATNGALGIQLAKMQLPSLILLDLEMPLMDGFGVLRELKKDVHTRDIPVIMITGATQSGAEEEALFLGAVDFIRKPFSEVVVKARVRTHVDLFSYRQTIESQLLVDLTTQVPNRRSANIILCEMWDNALEEKKPFSLAMIDIDSFSAITAIYGFQQSQYVLRTVADTIRKIAVQRDGFVARYDGDRFIAAFPNMNSTMAESVINAVRLSISDMAIPNKEAITGEIVTLSAGGCTEIPQSTEGLEGCIKVVESTMLSAKEKGRNCVLWKSKYK